MKTQEEILKKIEELKLIVEEDKKALLDLYIDGLDDEIELYFSILEGQEIIKYLKWVLE